MLRPRFFFAFGPRRQRAVRTREEAVAGSAGVGLPAGHRLRDAYVIERTIDFWGEGRRGREEGGGMPGPI